MTSAFWLILAAGAGLWALLAAIYRAGFQAGENKFRAAGAREMLKHVQKAKAVACLNHAALERLHDPCE